ncbi:MAG TPA: tetratricopeptide repeat protein [Bryobacteraceae bacterium]|jgi:TolB-like protein/Tfp pilus assembly protein PilF|nr:tetratricopeptide repeat protein [Bryobacteraceae bacterium]
MHVSDVATEPRREARKDSDEKVAAQLERILSSNVFRQADRLKRFLSFTVNETLAGRGERLKEFVIGIEVFGKGPGFDQRSDPIVRVQARRLRSQLARYYREEGQADEILIELPKGGYTPVFKSLRGVIPKRASHSALVSRNTILLIPFSDHSEAGDQKYFCDGLTQEIIHTLTGLDAIRLIARADVESDPREAAARDNAALVLTGSVRKAGGELRIVTNLIDAVSGCYLWSASIDRTLENILSVQSEVARAVAERLRTEIEGIAGPRRRPPGNLAAHNLYVQGRYHLNQRTEEGLRKALEFFEKAIAEDAQDALAYSGLSDAYGLLSHYGLMPPAEVWTKTASHAATAVLQDDQSAEAHTSLAHVKSTQDWDWAGAESEFLRAISLDPRYPTAHHWYASSCLAPQGRLEEALEQMLIAQELDPISSIIARDVAAVHFLRRDLSAALDQCDHTIEINPHFPQAYWILGLVQEQRGDFDESAAAFQRAIQLSPQSPRMQAALGRTFALSGKKDEAKRILKELHKRAGQRYESPFDLASLYLALGDRENGFKWLANAFRDRCFEVLSIKVDPRFDPFREDPAFTQLVKPLGLN